MTHARRADAIESWHAHVYFDAPRRDAAWALREVIVTALAGRMEMGRFHERPVGPHPMWSYQLAFAPAQFAAVLGWLTLNRGALDVFVHPNTGDALADHRDPRVVVGPLVRAEPGGARRVKSALCRLTLCAAAAILAGSALAADPLVAELEQRLASAGVESVNDYLSAHADSALSRFNRQTASCELQAVSLAIRLARGANARAVEAHEESLRAASGRCARFVLALVSAADVARVCASQASWGAAQTARELRRRIADIDADKLLHTTAQGQACRAAYLYELKNTRVTLRVASPPAVARER